MRNLVVGAMDNDKMRRGLGKKAQRKPSFVATFEKQKSKPEKSPRTRKKKGIAVENIGSHKAPTHSPEGKWKTIRNADRIKNTGLNPSGVCAPEKTASPGRLVSTP